MRHDHQSASVVPRHTQELIGPQRLWDEHPATIRHVPTMTHGTDAVNLTVGA
jgi:hypothetical protein